MSNDVTKGEDANDKETNGTTATVTKVTSEPSLEEKAAKFAGLMVTNLGPREGCCLPRFIAQVRQSINQNIQFSSAIVDEFAQCLIPE